MYIYIYISKNVYIYIYKNHICIYVCIIYTYCIHVNVLKKENPYINQEKESLHICRIYIYIHIYVPNNVNIHQTYMNSISVCK